MTRLAADAEARLLGLDEVADAIMPRQLGAGAQMRKRPDFGIGADVAFLGAHAQLQMASIADSDIREPCGALDAHAAPDFARAENLHVGTDDGVGADLAQSARCRP